MSLPHLLEDANKAIARCYNGRKLKLKYYKPSLSGPATKALKPFDRIFIDLICTKFPLLKSDNVYLFTVFDTISPIIFKILQRRLCLGASCIYLI